MSQGLEPITPEQAVDMYIEGRRDELSAQTLPSHIYRLDAFKQWCSEEEIANLNDLTADTGLLLAGDALVADGDTALAGPKPEFTPDMDRALESVADLATLEIDGVVCYHGGYVEEGTARIAAIAERSSGE